MRTFYLFKPGEEENGIELLNEFMRDIREISKKQDKNIQVAVRVPVTPAIGRKYGLDAVAWAKYGLVDIIIPSNYWYPTNLDIPVETWKAEIGANSSCIIAPGADLAFRCVEDWRTIVMHNSIETMRAFAVNAYSRGAGAVYLFNHFDWVIDKWTVDEDGEKVVSNDKPVIINEGGKMETVRGKPRIHVLTFASPDTGKIEAKLPRLIDKENTATFEIYTGPKPVTGKYIVRIGLDSLNGFHDAVFNVSVNGTKANQLGDLLKDTVSSIDKTNQIHVAKNLTEVAERVMQFEARAKILNAGYNTIEVGLESNMKQKVIWLEVYIH
ncbi:MAG: hypothetical protein HC905_05250 [Bacteroidales bacterium]|nr:hypothetical protein [Bacteroidales bacterium]